MVGNWGDGAPMIESGASTWSSSIHRHPYRLSANACGSPSLGVAGAKTTHVPWPLQVFQTALDTKIRLPEGDNPDCASLLSVPA